MIVMGTVKDNRWIQRINRKLGLRFNHSWTRLTASAKIPLLKPLAEDSGLLELIVNPFNPTKKIFIITGVNPKLFQSAMKIPFDRDRWRELQGNAALVGFNGNLFTFSLKNIPNQLKEGNEENSPSAKVKVNRAERENLILFGAMMVVMIAITGSIVVYLIRRKKRELDPNN